MRITHVNTVAGRGGAAIYAERLAEEQRARGHDARLLVTASYHSKTPAFCSVHPPVFADDSVVEGYVGYGVTANPGILDNPVLRTADVVHAHNLHGSYLPPSALAQLCAQAPLVWTLHDMQPLTGRCIHPLQCNGWLTGCGCCPSLYTPPAVTIDASAQMYRDKQRLYASCDPLVITPCRWLQSMASQSLLQHLDIEVIPSGIDTDLFRPTALRGRSSVVTFGIAADRLLANPFKGFTTFSKLIQALGDMRHEVEGLALGIDEPRVLPPGIRPLPACEPGSVTVETFFDRIDVYVSTSVAETFPLVLVEAAACGIPILAFDVGGIREIVEDGRTGYVVRPGHHSALLRAATALLDPTLRRDLGAAARSAAVERFGLDRMVRAYDDVYARAVKVRGDG
jgi:glycosyltransferase involved in cell wall biosynthesis